MTNKPDYTGFIKSLKSGKVLELGGIGVSHICEIAPDFSFFTARAVCNGKLYQLNANGIAKRMEG